VVPDAGHPASQEGHVTARPTLRPIYLSLHRGENSPALDVQREETLGRLHPRAVGDLLRAVATADPMTILMSSR
jgi:hypothetical protein